MTAHYIGLDVHCQFTEFAVVSSSGRLTKRGRCATTIPALLEVIDSVQRPRYVAFEEGPMAEWLYQLVALCGGGDGVRAAAQPLQAKGVSRPKAGQRGQNYLPSGAKGVWGQRGQEYLPSGGQSWPKGSGQRGQNYLPSES
jgi:hypothetical protein